MPKPAGNVSFVSPGDTIDLDRAACQALLRLIESAARRRGWEMTTEHDSAA
jgi:hypothetical protein